MKELMIQHGEKIALGVTGALLLIYVGIAFGMSASNPDITSALGKASNVDQLLRSNRPKEEPPKPYLAMARSPWSNIAAPAAGSDYSVYYKTKIKQIIKVESGGTAAVTVQPRRTHKSPEMAAPSAEIGKVTLKWTRLKDSTAPVAKYEIYRKKAGDKDFTKVGELEPSGETAGSESTWADTKVDAKADYSYKVKSIARDKDPKKVDEPERESNVVTVKTVSDINIVVKGGQETLAIIVVKKFMDQKWQEHTFPVKPGDMIGEKVKTYQGKEQVWIDFTTGYKLQEVKKEKRMVKRTEKQRVKDKETGLIKEVDVEKEYPIDSLKIIFTDDEGKQHEQWLES